VKPLFDYILQSNGFSDIFSVCLGPLSGRLFLGDNYTLQYVGNVSYVPTVVGFPFQAIIAKFTIGETSFMNDETVQIHFGDFNTVFSSSLYNKIRNIFQQNYGDSLAFVSDDGNLFDGSCVKISPSQIPQYPTITFSFATSSSRNSSTFVNIDFPPNFYMTNSADGSCVKLAFSPSTTNCMPISRFS